MKNKTNVIKKEEILLSKTFLFLLVVMECKNNVEVEFSHSKCSLVKDPIDTKITKSVG
jgi:hypothetical protein